MPPSPRPRDPRRHRRPTAACSARMDALPFGIAAWRLGAGRARAEDPVIHAAGIDLHVKPGDRVAAGQPLFTLLADDGSRFARALEALEGAWEIGDGGSDRRTRSSANASRPEARHRTHLRLRIRDADRAEETDMSIDQNGDATHPGASAPRPAQGVAARPPRRRGAPADDHRARRRDRARRCPRATRTRSPTGSPRRATPARSSSTSRRST